MNHSPRLADSQGSLLSGALVLALLTSPAAALETRISGFGTLGMACFSNDRADYRRDDVPRGPGRSHRCTGEQDSKLGVQADLEATSRLGATLQMTAIHNTDDDFKPQLTLANLHWHIGENWTVRAGRMQNPNFIYSEFRNVNYAQPWARPPGEVYNMLPTFLHDGVEMLYHSRVGGWDVEYHFGLARSDFNFPLSNNPDSLDVSIETSYLSITLERGPWLVKGSIAPSRSDATSPDVEQLLAALRASPTPGAGRLADDIEIKDKRYTLYSLGFSYDDGTWLWGGELVTRPTGGFVQQPITGYLSMGRRWGKWTGYAGIARLDGRQDDAHNTLPENDPLYPMVAGLLSSTHDLDRTTFWLGLSRELTDQATLKLQADLIQPDRDSFADYINHGPDYRFRDPDLDLLLSLNLDFVF
jgi:hypothetical protein